MGSAHHEHQLRLPSSSQGQRKLPRDLPAACKITLPQPTNTAAVICGCQFQSVCSELLKGITQEILQKSLLLDTMPQFVFSILQKNEHCEVEECLQNVLTYRHQVPQNCAGFSRLDSSSKQLTDKFKGHIYPLSTATYNKMLMTSNKNSLFCFTEQK